jgi:hypothetical protein
MAVTPKSDPGALLAVVELIVAGCSEAEITTALARILPGEDTRPILVAAMKELANAGRTDPVAVRGFVIEGTRTIYQRAMKKGDYRTALQALRQLNDVAGH